MACKELEEEHTTGEWCEPELSGVSSDGTTALTLRGAVCNIKPQSEEGGAVTTEEVVMTFQDPEKEEQVSVPDARDIVSSNQADAIIELKDYLARPVKVFAEQWEAPPYQFDEYIYPWNNVINNPRVINRLANYRQMRATLRLRIIVNGNPFMYGRLMASYFPMYDVCATRQTTLTPADNVRLSQMQKIFIDPSISKGGEMTIPFSFYKDYIDLTEYNTEADDPLLSDAVVLGRLFIRELNPLRHAMGSLAAGETHATITIFGWLEDVELSGLTTTNPLGIVPQALSDGLSKAAGAAKSLTSVPVVGKYAKASEIALTAGSQVAKALGYCREIDTSEKRYVNPGIGRLANVDTPDMVSPLSVFSNQEVTVDPTVCGNGDNQDPLNILGFAQRESLLTTFQWIEEDLPEELLMSFAVKPVAHWIVPIGSSRTDLAEHHATPLSLATMPFALWRGSIRYRIQFVASNVHRGRALLVYDPHSGASNMQGQENTVYSHIIDLSVSREYVFEIEMCQPTPWLPTDEFYETTDTVWFSGTGPIGYDKTQNGVWSLYVLNELTAPSLAPSVDNRIEMNVFISAGSTFEVSNPRGDDVSQTTIHPQSLMSTFDVSDNAAEHMIATTVTLGHKMPEVDTTAIFVGESVQSFRSLFERYCHVYSYAGVDQTDPFVTRKMVSRMIPPTRGYVPGAIWATTLTNFNFVNTHISMIIAYCFSGIRGSTRWKVVRPVIIGSYEGHWATVTRRNGKIQMAYYDHSIPQFATASQIADGESDLYSFAATGTDVCETRYTALQFAIPHYSQYRFKLLDSTDHTSLLKGIDGGFEIDVNPHTSNVREYLRYYFATGSDFSVCQFVGVPILYKIANAVPV